MTEQTGVLVKKDQLKQEVSTVVRQAQSLTVRNADEYRVSADYRKQNKTVQKKVCEVYDPIIKAQNDALKVTRCEKAKYMDPLLEGDAIARQKQERWLEEQERIAERERQRLQAEQDERARKEQEKLAAQAKKAEEKGNTEKAEALRDMADAVVPSVVHVETEAPKVEGNAIRKVWESTVTDPRAFLAFVAQEQTGMWMGTVEISIPALNRMAKGDVAPNVPGVTYRRRIISASGAAK